MSKRHSCVCVSNTSFYPFHHSQFPELGNSDYFCDDILTYADRKLLVVYSCFLGCTLSSGLTVSDGNSNIWCINCLLCYLYTIICIVVLVWFLLL